MVSWLVRRIVSHNLTRMRAGDYQPTLRLVANDVVFRFPGASSWAGEWHGRSEVEQWYERFASAGLQIFPDEDVAKGFPWTMTICVRGHILRTSSGCE